MIQKLVACIIKVKQYPCFIWNMVVAWMIYGSTLKRILWAVQVCSANSNFVYVRPFSLNKWFNSRSTFSSKLSDPICYKHTNQGQLCQTILHSNLMYDTKGICDFNFQVKIRLWSKWYNVLKFLLNSILLKVFYSPMVWDCNV